MITISHFTAGWLFPTLWYILFLIITYPMCRRDLEIGAIPGMIIRFVGTLIYFGVMVHHFWTHWDQFHIIPKIFNVQG